MSSLSVSAPVAAPAAPPASAPVPASPVRRSPAAAPPAAPTAPPVRARSPRSSPQPARTAPSRPRAANDLTYMLCLHDYAFTTGETRAGQNVSRGMKSMVEGGTPRRTAGAPPIAPLPAPAAPD